MKARTLHRFHPLEMARSPVGLAGRKVLMPLWLHPSTSAHGRREEATWEVIPVEQPWTEEIKKPRSHTGVPLSKSDVGHPHAWSVTYLCHALMQGADRHGLKDLKNFGQLPMTSTTIFPASPRIWARSGSSLRTLAPIRN